ncbi:MULTISPECIES: ATP-binding cassette domain-containing protein [Staphylococcus]|uniref:ABC transporter ATP-binding protein n=1 Tax=Staphylococcus hsinchuensis TaxID=3051183 RepID=A0ABZ3EAM1_9STAP|nr:MULTISPECIES: ABC transporter ATP-binding protein [unclassified Staphylococcus]
MLELKDISKIFESEHDVLNNVNATFRDGTINCIVGKNGAGKTTLLNILSSIIMPTEGVIYYNNKNIIENTNLRKQIFYIAVKPFFYEKLTAQQNVELICNLYEVRVTRTEIKHTFNKVGLDDGDRKKAVNTFSSGMKQKLNFVAMLLVNAPIVLLDEPFNALDTQTQDLFLTLLKTLADHNHTIIFTSHITETIFKLAENICVLKEGQFQTIESASIFESTEQLEQWINNHIYENFEES